MRGLKWILITILILLFLASDTVIYAEQKEQVRLEHVKTIKNKDIAYTVFSSSICGNYVSLNLNDGPTILDYIKNEEIKIFKVKDFGWKIAVTTFSPDCNYAIVRDIREPIEENIGDNNCGYILPIYIFSIKEKKIIATLNTCSENYAFSQDGKQIAIRIPTKYKNREDEKLPFKLIQLTDINIFGWLDDNTLLVYNVIKKRNPKGGYVDYYEYYSLSLNDGQKHKIISGYHLYIEGLYKNGVILRDTTDEKYDVYYYNLETQKKRKIASDVWNLGVSKKGYIFLVKWGKKFILPNDAGVDDTLMIVDINDPYDKPKAILKFKNTPAGISISPDGNNIAFFQLTPKEMYNISIYKLKESK